MPCIHDPSNPRGCYRVRCQLGNRCAEDPPVERGPTLRPEQRAMAAVWLTLAVIGLVLGSVHLVARCAS